MTIEKGIMNYRGIVIIDNKILGHLVSVSEFDTLLGWNEAGERKSSQIDIKRIFTKNNDFLSTCTYDDKFNIGLYLTPKDWDGDISKVEAGWEITDAKMIHRRVSGLKMSGGSHVVETVTIEYSIIENKVVNNTELPEISGKPSGAPSEVEAGVYIREVISEKEERQERGILRNRQARDIIGIIKYLALRGISCGSCNANKEEMCEYCLLDGEDIYWRQ